MNIVIVSGASGVEKVPFRISGRTESKNIESSI